MHIKTLEILGFKSFKNKTVLNFDNHITGIVGPNGCGKSNIVDALLWVMGETAPKHLRSVQLSDVIFGGTTSHPQANMAEVSLTLAKGEGRFPEKYNKFEELMITRRSFRDGDTEYYINQQPCRLKDIREIFMDTGAGCRGFSIIEQDAVEKLITAKPSERRFIIEEVAGITKFKTRKQETIRKLEKVNINLKRIDDIIKQQDKQLVHLSRQAQRAEKYRELKNQHKEKEVELNYRLWQGMQKKQKSLEEQIKSEKGKKLSLETEKEQLKASLIEIEKNNSQQIQSVEESKKYISDLELKIVDRKKETEKRQEAISIYRSQLEQEKNSESLAEQERQAHDNKLDELQIKQAHVESEQKSLEQKIDSLENDLKKGDLDSNQGMQQNSNLEQGLLKDKSFLSELVVKQKTKENQITLLVQDKKRKEEELSQIEIEQENLLKSKQKTRTVLEKSQQMKMDFIKNSEDFDKNFQLLEERKSKEENELNELKKELSLIEYKAQNLDQLIQKFQDAEGAGSQLMNWKPKQFNPARKGMTVEAGFEQAVEASLSPFLGSLLTEAADAIQGLEHLKETQKGSCSFIIPSDQNPSFSFDIENLKKYPALLGSIRDKVKFNTPLPAFQSRLEKTFLITNLRAGLQLKKKFPELNFVTKEGDLITNDGFIWGGSKAQANQLLKLENEQAEAKKIFQTKKSELNIKQVNFDKTARNLKETQKEYEKIKTSHVKMDVNLAENQKDIESLDKRLIAITEKKEQLEDQQNQASAQIQKLKQEVEELNQSLFKQKEEVAKKEQILNQIYEVDSKHKSEQMKLNELKQARQDKLSQLEIIKKEQELLNKINTQSNSKTELMKTQQARVKDSISKQEKEVKELNEELELFNQEKAEMQKELETKQNEYKSLLTSIDEKKARLEQSYQDQRSAERSEEHAQTEIEKIEIQKTNIKDRLIENHGFDLTQEVFIPRYESTSTESLELELSQIGEQLGKTGEVNFIALEEHEELLSKNTFIKNQRNDLENSKKSLSQVISHIDKTCDSRFKDMLNEINERFSRVFPILFEGDKAEARLILKDEEEGKELGVDILVRPPGKKPQSVTLLSRGEKALTSLCLIYSLFLVKPSPFCVLDEIDAPLDDANVFRYISVMKEMAQKSQIITITHNKYTMQACENLYGVTMEEKGVSQIVSVNLKQAAETSLLSQ